MNEQASNYILDLGALLKESAREARAQRDNAERDGSTDFESGRVSAFHEVISLMQAQADAFGIELALISLDDIDAERDLL